MPTISDLRSSVSELTRLASVDLAVLWRQVSASTPDQAQTALLDVLPSLVEVYGLAAGTVAADWYDDVRDELNIDRRFSAIVADVDDRGADVLARWAVGPLYAAERDWDRAFELAEGGMQRRIADISRDTVKFSAQEDPSAEGWQRSASAGACKFCVMLEARGEVYRSASVDFGAHDNCDCVAVAAFSGVTKPVKAYTPTDRTITDADRALTRKWLNENIPDARG